MAKHVIIEQYTFTPSTNTILINGKNLRREQLLLITNVTRNTVIYNFSDPTLTAASFTNVMTGQSFQTTYAGGAQAQTEQTTIVLSYSTAAMSSTDKLSILYEETYTEMIPAETNLDPVGKFRVSEPQAMIDTDFEYGVQPTKWESITMLNNRPTAYYIPTQSFNILTTISSITASGTTVTVNLASTTNVAVGMPIFVLNALDSNANGWWLVNSVTTNTSFTYQTLVAPATTLFDGYQTYVFPGAFYQNAAIPMGSGASITLSGTTGTVTTQYPHGLNVNNQFMIVGTSVTGINNTFVVATTPTNNTFTFATTVTGSPSLNGGSLGTLYPKALGYVTHRAFDGGVQFTNLLPYHGYQVIRQTRRYFRYQSGKSMQFSTGTMLKPGLNVDSVTSSGTTVTVTVKYNHGLAPGAFVQVSGCTATAYNGIFQVVSAPSITQFTYTALSTPSLATDTGFPINVSPYSWYGSRNRVGMFDQQNGFFYEFDGQTLWAVKRSSTTQLSGFINVTNGSGQVTGTNTQFPTSLIPGDFVVIRGMSYIVQNIQSNTTMTIYPEYRGTTDLNTNIVISKTIDQRYPQSAWNIDRCDGTGASLYNVDLTKMQMLYMDYSWYGAGACRWGFKNNRGEVIYAHRSVNNNVNTEAWMRSGNMCARYETNTFALVTYLTASISSGATTGATISGFDFTGWPTTGTVIVTASGATSAAIEYITYSTRTNTALTIAARAQTGGQGSAQTFTYSATAPIQLALYSPANASTISHWGSSVIMDGKYDDDKSLLFNTAMLTGLTNLTPGTRYALISLRASPSVDNGFSGLLGQHEILNRMQIIMRQLNAYTTQPFRIELILNGIASAGTFQPVGGSSLSQFVLHGAGTTISGGESMYSFFTGASAYNVQDISIVRDLGTNILGGGVSLAYPPANPNGITAPGMYPDGPDIITVCATCVGSSTNSINASLSWTEAQA